MSFRGFTLVKLLGRLRLQHFDIICVSPFIVALSYLYSGEAVHKITPANARGVLAASCLLGGMDDLANQAYLIALQSIDATTVIDWVNFVESLPRSDGTRTPSQAQQRPSVLGAYAPALREAVFNFLILRLPAELNLESDEGRNILLDVFTQLG